MRMTLMRIWSGHNCLAQGQLGFWWEHPVAVATWRLLTRSTRPRDSDQGQWEAFVEVSCSGVRKGKYRRGTGLPWLSVSHSHTAWVSTPTFCRHRLSISTCISIIMHHRDKGMVPLERGRLEVKYSNDIYVSQYNTLYNFRVRVVWNQKISPELWHATSEKGER